MLSTLGRADIETYYTPRRVAYWIEHWSDLRELATPTVPGIRYDKIGRVPEGFKPTDPFKYSNVLTDLERAWIALGNRWSIEFVVIEYTMQGYPLREIEMTYRLPGKTVYDSYRRACEQMAKRLGWRES